MHRANAFSFEEARRAALLRKEAKEKGQNNRTNEPNTPNAPTKNPAQNNSANPAPAAGAQVKNAQT